MSTYSKGLKAGIFCLLFCVCLAFSAQAVEYPIPHLTGDASDWRDLLLVTNVDGGDSHEFRLQLFADGAELYDETFRVFMWEIKTINLKELGVSGAQCGLITTESERLVFRLSFENLNGGGVAEFALDETNSRDLALTFSDYTPIVSWKGLGLANLTDEDIVATLSARGSGSQEGFILIEIPARTNISGVVPTLFPFADVQDTDNVLVRATGPLSGVVISGAQDMSQLLFSKAQGGLNLSSISNPGSMTGTWESFSSGDDATLSLTHVGNDISGTLEMQSDVCGVINTPIAGYSYGFGWSFTASFSCNGAPAELLAYSGGKAQDLATIAYAYLLTVNGVLEETGSVHFAR